MQKVQTVFVLLFFAAALYSSTPLFASITSPDSPAPLHLATATDLTPVADAYVSRNAPGTNYGSVTQLRVRGNPSMRSYLRFRVQNVTGAFARVTLWFYSSSSQSSGFTVSRVESNLWVENAINYNNAPAVYQALGSSGPVSAGQWTSVDLTGYVVENETYSFALTSNSGNVIALSSRESDHAPQLIIETESGSIPLVTPTAADTVPPSTPQQMTPAATAILTEIPPTNMPTSTNTPIIPVNTPTRTTTPLPSPTFTLIPVMPTNTPTRTSTPAPTNTLPPAPTSTPVPSGSVGLYNALELTYPYYTNGNPWESANLTPYITGVFKSPSGKILNVDGFYYDINTYKLRFTPTELGNYSYTITLSGGAGGLMTYTGSFSAVATGNNGFIRKAAGNPYRLITEADGKVLAGAGFNDSWATGYNTDSSGNLMGWINNHYEPIDNYLTAHTQEGYNMFRFNPGNGSNWLVYQSFTATGNTYQVQESKYVDQLFQKFRAYGYHNIFTFFRSAPPSQDMNALKRAIRYTVARWGAYTDLWEIDNEQSMDGGGFFTNAQIADLANYVRSIDPYKRLVMNSNPQTNDWSYLDVRSPHIVPDPNDYGIAAQTNNNFTNGAAVIAGEMDNKPTDAQTTSLVRMSTWSSFMAGMPELWWNAGLLAGGSRPSVVPFKNTVADLDPAAVSSQVSATGGVVGYQLSSAKSYLVYLEYQLGNTTLVSSQATLNVPFAGTGTWIDPATGNIKGTVTLNAGTQTLSSPAFSEDLILKLR